MVVDFAVEDDDRIAVIGNDGLVAGFQINNLETRRAERYEICFEDALLVRPAVNERIRRGLNAARSRLVILLSEACDSTQLRSPRSGRKRLMAGALASGRHPFRRHEQHCITRVAAR